MHLLSYTMFLYTQSSSRLFHFTAITLVSLCLFHTVLSAVGLQYFDIW